jgi:hypothetical protein
MQMRTTTTVYLLLKVVQMLQHPGMYMEYQDNQNSPAAFHLHPVVHERPAKGSIKFYVYAFYIYKSFLSTIILSPALV